METIRLNCKKIRLFGPTVCLSLAGTLLIPQQSDADDGGYHWGGACMRTATLAFLSCGREAKSDRFQGNAICQNIGDEEEKAECLEEVFDDFQEDKQTCRERRNGRFNLCFALNEDLYDPEIDPAEFDPTFAVQNLYFPLGAGDMHEYVAIDDEGEFAEYISVEVQDKTKAIQGLTCRVINDIVTEACDDDPCDVIEDTDDWYAQKNNGDTYYCGEESKDFEYTDGDMPREAELVEIDGSFKGGRDGDKMGIIFKGNPMVGDIYRQEWSLRNAEDWGEVLSTSYGTGDGFDADTEDEESLDYMVPEDLAEYFCSNNNCVVTKDGNALEPGAVERKYYAPGVGVFLEVDLEDEEIVRIVGCSVAADLGLHGYCAGDIPQPEEP